MSIKILHKNSRDFLKRILYDLSIIVVSVSLLYVALVAYAGSLVPPGSVAPTMWSLNDIYNAIAGTYDSNAVQAKENGNAMEILKCITNKMNNDVCN